MSRAAAFSAVLAAACLLLCSGHGCAPVPPKPLPSPPESSSSAEAPRAVLDAAEKLCEQQKWEEAAARLRALRPVGTTAYSEEQNRRCKKILRRIHAGLAERGRRRAESEHREALQLLDSLRSLVERGSYGEAIEPLAALAELGGRLTADQRVDLMRLRRRVGEATGRMPGASEEEKRHLARRHLRSGLGALKGGDYPAAERELAIAARLQSALGDEQNRRLRDARAAVEARLGGLRSTLKAARNAYQRGDLQEAAAGFRKVLNSPVSPGEKDRREAERLLAEAQDRMVRREAESLKERQDRAAALQARAEKARSLHARLVRLLGQSDEALRDGDLSRARSLLKEARGTLEESGLQEEAVLATQSRKVDQKLAALDRLAAERERRRAAEKEAEGLLQQAGKLLESDVAEAEKTAEQARLLAERQQVGLTDSGLRTYRRIQRVIRARYGPLRRWARSYATHLFELAECYRQRGEHGRAAEVLSFLRDSDPAVLAEGIRARADAAVEQAGARQQQQMKRARELSDEYEGARQELAGRRFRAALDAREELLEALEEAELAGRALREVREADLRFLTEDFGNTLAGARPDYPRLGRWGLKQARRRIASFMAEFYQARNAPDLAEPYLQRVAEQGGPAGARAREELKTLQHQKERAERRRVLAVKQEVEEVYRLSEKLHGLVLDGELEESRKVERQVAAARLRLQAEKAELAYERGAYREANRMLEEAPADAVPPELVEDICEPVRAHIERAAAASRELEAAEDAFAEADFAEAAGLLAAVQKREPLPRDLKVQMEILAVELEPIRQAGARYAELRTLHERALEAAKARLEELKRRERAWDRYAAGVEALLKDPFGGGEEKLRSAVSGEVHLEAVEIQRARAMLGDVEEIRKPAVEEAEKFLARAERHCSNGAYGEAAAELKVLRKLPGYRADAALRERANAVKEQVRASEQAARRLYERAVQARGEGRVEDVRRLLKELKQRYSGTEVYRSGR